MLAAEWRPLCCTHKTRHLTADLSPCHHGVQITTLYLARVNGELLKDHMQRHFGGGAANINAICFFKGRLVLELIEGLSLPYMADVYGSNGSRRHQKDRLLHLVCFSNANAVSGSRWWLWSKACYKHVISLGCHAALESG